MWYVKEPIRYVKEPYITQKEPDYPETRQLLGETLGETLVSRMAAGDAQGLGAGS